MARRDQLTYDVDPTRRSRAGVSPGLVVLLIAVVVIAAALVTWTVLSSPAPAPKVAAPAAAPTLTPSPTVARSSPSASPTRATSPATKAGSDAAATAGAPGGSTAAATHFIAAWLETDARTRKAELRQTAAPGLAEELMLTSKANIPRVRPVGAPALENASTYSVRFTQRFSDRLRVRVYLVADPQAKYGWLATSIERL